MLCLTDINLLLCVSLKTIGDGILSFIDEMRPKIINHVLKSGSLQDVLEQQCNCDKNRQQWLANSLTDYVVKDACRQKLKFGHCYLFSKSAETNTGTVRVTITHGVERKSAFVDTNNEYIEDNDFLSASRPRLHKNHHPETYLYLHQNSEVTYPLIGGMTASVNLPSGDTSKSRKARLQVVFITYV